MYERRNEKGHKEMAEFRKRMKIATKCRIAEIEDMINDSPCKWDLRNLKSLLTINTLIYRACG